MQTKSRLRRAQQRLESAMVRLDEAIQNRVLTGEKDADIEFLKNELDDARRERERLHTLTDNVANRLDDTITRLRRVIGS